MTTWNVFYFYLVCKTGSAASIGVSQPNGTHHPSEPEPPPKKRKYIKLREELLRRLAAQQQKYKKVLGFPVYLSD